MSSNVIRLVPRTAAEDPSPTTTVERAVYTVPEVAYLLSLSLGSTYALLRDGTIPARKTGARWVISKRRFHHWLDNLPEASVEDLDEELRRYEHGRRT